MKISFRKRTWWHKFKINIELESVKLRVDVNISELELNLEQFVPSYCWLRTIGSRRRRAPRGRYHEPTRLSRAVSSKTVLIENETVEKVSKYPVICFGRQRRGAAVHDTGALSLRELRTTRHSIISFYKLLQVFYFNFTSNISVFN